MSGVRVPPPPYIEEVPYQFLYREGETLHLMNPANCEQVTASVSLLKDKQAFLQDSMELAVSFYDETPIAIRLPATVVLEVLEADPVVKGQTASASYKPAVLNNGVKLQVPPHITMGTKIVVNTADSSYVERAK